MKTPEQKTTYLAVSQDVTYLYPLLKQSLFSSNNFFEKRVVVVEHFLIKQWLQLQMAEDPDLHISMGLEFLDGERVFEALLGMFCATPLKILPGKGELALLIQEWGKEQEMGWGKSCRIAEYFASYSRFGGGEMPKHLQSIWHRMADQYGWISCKEALQRAIESPVIPTQGSLHFFCPRLLTREEVQFLEYLAKTIPVWIYQFSPCELFWSDLCSDWEKARLLRYWENKTGPFTPAFLQLQQLLEDRHPLLANWGTLGRRMAREWEDSSVQSMAYYPKSHPPKSLLQQVKEDILAMSLPSPRPSDSSIQLIGAINPREEVEMVYQALVQLFDQQKELEPKDCVIFVSQPTLYIPYLQAVFGRPHQPIPYSIQDEPPSPSSLLSSFQFILKLKESRWDKACGEALLSLPALQRARGFSPEETCQLKQWIDQQKIDWGIDATFRKKWLENWGEALVETEEADLTWEGAFTAPFIISSQNSVEPQLELLQKWRQTLWELFHTLQPWRENVCLPVKEWSRHLLSLCKNFLAPDPACEEEAQEYTHLLQILSDLPLRLPHLQQERFSAHSFYQFLCDRLNSTPSSSLLQAVHIGSFVPFLNKRVIVCMGMGEGEFPRKDVLFSGYAPSQGESDRYFLLEILFTTKLQLFFSYSHTTQEGTPQTLSPVLQAFFTFLEGYGQPISEIQSCGSVEPATESIPPRFFLEKELKMPLKPLEAVILPKTLSLSQMRSAFRNPIQSYCEKKWGFSFPPQQKKQTPSPCQLDALAKFSIRESFLSHPFEEALHLAKNQWYLPKGVFSAYAKEELAETFSQLWGYLNAEGVEMGEIFSVECTSQVCTPTLSSSHLWLFPPLPVVWNGSPCHIVGKIPHVSQQGLISPRKGDWKTLWRSWPEFVVYCGLVQHFHLPWKQQVLFTETESTKPSFFAEFAPHLGSATAFSSLVLQQPCPLLPDWVPPLIQSDMTALQEAVQETLHPFSKTGEEGWWKWIFDRDLSVQEWGEHFGPCARSVGEPLYNAWGKK